MYWGELMNDIQTINNEIIKVAQKIYSEKITTGKNKITLSALHCGVQNHSVFDHAIETLHQKYHVIRRIEKVENAYSFYVDQKELVYLLDTIAYRISHQDPYLELKVISDDESEVVLFLAKEKSSFPVLRNVTRYDVLIRDYLVRLILMSRELPDVSLFESREYDLSLFQKKMYRGWHFLESEKIDSSRLVDHVSEYATDQFKSVYKLFIQTGSSKKKFFFRPAITQFQFDLLSVDKKHTFQQLLEKNS